MNFDSFEASKLKALAIMNTDVKDFDFASLHVPTLRWLDISYNRISSFDTTEMQQLMYLNISRQTSKRCFSEYTILPDSLMFVDFSETARCSSLSICLFHVEFVNLRNTNTKLTKFFSDVKLFKNKDFFAPCSSITRKKVAIKHLDLQDNDIKCINSTIFTQHDWSALNVLKLSNNKLGSDDSACADTNVTQFMDFLKPLWNLTDLYLDENPIKYVFLPDMLLNQTKLQSLHLSLTRLTNLTLKMNHLMDLKLLNISRNKIQCLYTSTMRDINKIIHYNPGKQNTSKVFELNLSHNDLRCSCSCLEFYQWMRNFRPYITFTDLDSYQCTFDNGRKEVLSDLNLIVDILRFQCVSRDWSLLTKTTTTILTVFSLILIATTSFRFRHTLRYIWLKHKMHRQYLERQILDPKYNLDAFVSCDRADAIWVKRNFLPKLENQQTGLKFCVAQRDFLVGATIIHNIVRSIKRSRKVVCVISQNFLKSGWCKEELLIGHQESLFRGKNILICIFMPDIIQQGLPDTFRYILNHVTCIKWPRDPAAQQVFWIMLQRGLLDGEEPNVYYNKKVRNGDEELSNKRNCII